MSISSNTPPQPTGYLLLFRKTDWDNGLPESEVREALEKVSAWMEGLTAAGKIVAAQPLMEESVIVSGSGGRSVTDGPFAEAKEVIGGFVLLAVESMEEAVALAKANPMNEYGLTTEVRATASSCPHTYRTLNRLAEAVA